VRKIISDMGFCSGTLKANDPLHDANVAELTRRFGNKDNRT
jgi:hypothetical protein